MRSLLDFLCSKVHKTQAKFHPHLNPNWLVSDGSKAQVRIWSTLFPEWKRHDLIRALKILYESAPVKHNTSVHKMNHILLESSQKGQYPTHHKKWKEI